MEVPVMIPENGLPRDRAVRCSVVMFSDNHSGVNSAAQLISNMYNLDREAAWREVYRASILKAEHKKLGGTLKDFEDGLILRNNDVCPAGHENHERVKAGEIEYWRADGTYYHIKTSPEMVELLERIRKGDTRVRFHWGDTITGKDWGDSYDVTGTLGRTTGPVKVPILLHNKRSMGGGAILTQCIVKITTTQGKRVLYEHPLYHLEEDT